MAIEKRWTPAQAAAIAERNRTLLVSAAAGSGKTATLTERVIRMLTDPEHPTDISRMLVVTFTNAAAGELRDRISAAIENALQRDPQNMSLARQLLLLPDADICTIDGFCRKLLQEHAADAGLAADFRISDESETALLYRTVMEQLIDRAYAGEEDGIASGDDFATFADHLVSAKNEAALTDILIELYQKTDGLPQGARAYFAYAERLLSSAELPPESTPWGAVLCSRAADLARHARTALANALAKMPQDSPVTEKCLPAIDAEIAYYGELLRAAESSYAEVKSVATSFPAPRLPGFRSDEDKAVVDLYRAVRDRIREERKALLPLFLYSPEQWRPVLVALGEVVSLVARLLERFDTLLREEKRRRGIASFADLEHLALKLLIKDGEPSALARELGAGYDAIFIDEYQDINSVQHKIFEAISTERNRFMVGDIKQSIYGFRLAEPEIFASMRAAFPRLEEAGDSPSATVFMSDNFRCDSTVIDFVNAVFDRLLGAAGASIGYSDGDRLVCAKAPVDGVLPKKATLAVFKSRSELKKELDAEASADEESDVDEDEEISEEVLYVAGEIARLLREERLANGEPIRPGDIAILLRSAKGRAPIWREALLSLGIPAASEEKDSFFLNPEIHLALCLLNTIDNPRRDIHLAGLLLSPLFDFTADDLLAARRASERSLPLYDALVAYTEAHPDFEKGKRFLALLARLRERAEGMPIDQLMRLLFAETGLLSVGGEGGGRRNLLLLYHFARTYSASSFKGLYQFIGYINEIIREKKRFRVPDASGDAGGAVRIMTIHGSKGLEFPVCFVADAGKSAYQKEKGGHVFDLSLGLALRLRDSTGFARVENPIRRAILASMEDKAAEESLRLLYVALTRARERLYVTGTVSGNTSLERLLQRCRLSASSLDGYTVRRAGSYLELCLSALGESSPVADILIHPTPFVPPAEGVLPASDAACAEPDPDVSRILCERFSYEYRFPHLGKLPGKLSVSRLSPSVLDGSNDHAASLNAPAEEPPKLRLPRFYSGEDPALGAKRGTATHEFLQFCDLRRLLDLGVDAEAERLLSGRYLSAESLSLVRRDELEVFRASPLLAEMLDAGDIRRELRFNVMLPASLFSGDPALAEALGDSEVLVQGVMDCVFISADGTLTLVDYKTDRIPKGLGADAAASFLLERHRDQLRYYAMALRKIYGRAPDRILLYSLCLGKGIQADLSLSDFSPESRSGY